MLVAALLAAPAAAEAGPFGGFSADGSRWLRGKDQVCEPLAAIGGELRCETAGARDVAARTFRTGRKQGAGGFRATSSGATLSVFAPGQERAVAVWSADGVISRVVAVYASDDGALVAVEYEARALSRAVTDAVAFRVREAAPAAPAPAPGAVVEPEADPGAEHRAAGDKALRKKKYAAAAAHYRTAFDANPRDAAAAYGRALALARAKQLEEALLALRAVAGVDDDRGIPHLVAARTEKAFARLRDRDEFKRIVGLVRPAGAEPWAHDRLVAGTARWERPFVACEEAGVVLRLDGKRSTFTLKIIAECKGTTDTLHLDGTWSASGTDTLGLRFPNPEVGVEAATCSLAVCGDGSGEDCLSCDVGEDLAFVLRPVRR
jgi:hypothetical protein